jgi:PBSX family phage terminase large subunit
MDDNLSLSQRTRERYDRRWAKGSIFYRRYILGEWCLAEGVIYDFFDISSASGYVVDSLPAFSKYIVGVDYGTANACCFLLLGKAGDTWTVAKEYYWDSVKQGRQKTNLQYSQDFKEFLGSVHPYSIDVDPSALAFITQLRQDYPNLIIKHAINQVLPGIQTVSSLMTSGKLKIHSSCKNTIESISSYSWDPKAQQRGEDAPMKVNDHAADSLRYATMRAVRI